jgi:hypothetical protein
MISENTPKDINMALLSIQREAATTSSLVNDNSIESVNMALLDLQRALTARSLL